MHSQVITAPDSGKPHKKLTGSYANSTNLLFGLELVVSPLCVSVSISIKRVYINGIYFIGLLGILKIKCLEQYSAHGRQASCFADSNGSTVPQWQSSPAGNMHKQAVQRALRTDLYVCILAPSLTRWETWGPLPYLFGLHVKIQSKAPSTQ